ncbi:MAG: PQQ-binding-like beta-propeller repeat protein, partial [Bacillota bacterium]
MIIKWKFRSRGVIESGAAIDKHGTIYCGDNYGILYALDAKQNLKWKFDTGGSLKSTPVIGLNGNLYLKVHHLNDYQLQSITPFGNLRWSLSIASSGKDSPAIGKDGTIYLAGVKLYAINPAGYRKWGISPNGRETITSSPIIGKDETIYFKSDENSKLYAVTKNGHIKWDYQLSEGSFWSSAAVGQQGTIYSGSSKLDAVNPDGTKKWSYEPRDWISSNIVIGQNETIYFGCGEELYALDQDGSLKWIFKAEADILSSPVLAANGLIYVASDRLYAINKQGQEVNVLDTGGFLSDPVIDSQGILYFGSGTELYAINDQTGGLAAAPWPV